MESWRLNETRLERYYFEIWRLLFIYEELSSNFLVTGFFWFTTFVMSWKLNVFDDFMFNFENFIYKFNDSKKIQNTLN